MFHISIKLLHFISLIYLFSQTEGGDPCPQKELLSPCTCSQKLLQSPRGLLKTTVAPKRTKRDVRDNQITPEFPNHNDSLFITVECKGIKSQNDLEEKFSSALDRKWVDKLIISTIPPKSGDTLAELPSNWLNNVRILQIQIQNTQLSGDFSWRNQPFRFQTQSLHWLTVNDCYLYGALTYDTIGTVQTRGLNILQRLQGIDLSSNHLTALMATAFKVPPKNLTTVILSQNNIQDIEAAAFNTVPLLKHLDLSHNQLAAIRRNIFAAPARLLEYIDLSWNSIQDLPVDFFVNMPALKYVNIAYNFLFSLPSRPWSLVWRQLSSINVLGNFIECDCELLWMLPMLPQNGTATEQLVKGQCAQPLFQPDFQTVSHDLLLLKREKLAC